MTASKHLVGIQKRFVRLHHFRCSHNSEVYLEVVKSLHTSELATRRCSRDLVFCLSAYTVTFILAL